MEIKPKYKVINDDVVLELRSNSDYVFIGLLNGRTLEQFLSDLITLSYDKFKMTKPYECNISMYNQVDNISLPAPANRYYRFATEAELNEFADKVWDVISRVSDIK